MQRQKTVRLTLAALFLALGWALPFVTGQLPAVGSMLAPMHLPALLCGFVCGWPYGLFVGFVIPLTRSLIFGMPPMLPTALAMAFELATYGLVTGLLYRRLPRTPANVYLTLVAAMLAGRVVWGLVSIPIYRLFTPNAFTLAAFWSGAFLRAWPGILLMLVLVPPIVLALQRAKLLQVQSA